MKRLFTGGILLLFTIWVFAQAPDKLSYQAVIRDAGGNLVKNKEIGIRVSILQNLETGTEVYKEIYNPNPQTNANGLMTLEIGSGIPITGNFADINWANGSYFIKTETDPDGGTNYTITAATQLLSVPYSLHAKTADRITGIIPETDPYFDASMAKGITGSDITNWNNKLDSYTETQNIGDVAALDNLVNTQLKNVTDPTDAQDATTKAYVDALKNELHAIEDILISVRIFTLYDADGNPYNVLKIGNQVWMAENLKTTKFNDGTPIPLVTDSTAWGNLTSPGYCWYKNDMGTYGVTYGALYNFYTVNTGKMCPTGWHVSTWNDWLTLIAYLGGGAVGGKLKEIGTVHWFSPNTGATNETGFTALPGGKRQYSSQFTETGSRGYWWTPEISTGYSYNFWLTYGDTYVGGQVDHERHGFSVRCVRNP